MIEVNNIKKIYGKETVLNLPDLKIEKGESFGLVGNNGAGKTTFFRLILDLIRANNGNILSKENDVAKTEAWKYYTGSYLDEGFLIDYLTPEEYFYFVGKLNGMDKISVDGFLSDFSDFFNDEILNGNKYIRDLSKGNQKKVGIVAALISQPEILILDEPFSNLDPTSQYQLKKKLKQYHEANQLTMLISSHDLNHVTEVCKRIVVLHKGEIVHDLQTNPDTLKKLEDYFAIEGEETNTD